MANQYVSEIIEAEYPAWRRVLHGFPDSYSAWRWYFSHDKTIAGLAGDEVVAVIVHPADYVSHCNTNTIAISMASFRDFAQMKSGTS